MRSVGIGWIQVLKYSFTIDISMILFGERLILNILYARIKLLLQIYSRRFSKCYNRKVLILSNSTNFNFIYSVRSDQVLNFGYL